MFSAETAQNLGLLNEVVADDVALDTQIEAWCKNFANASPQALADCKRMLDVVGHRENTPALRIDTARRSAESRASADGMAGMAAFLGKTAPPWLV